MTILPRTSIFIFVQLLEIFRRAVVGVNHIGFDIS